MKTISSKHGVPISAVAVKYVLDQVIALELVSILHLAI